MAAQRSVVKWFDAKKGYGFIVHPDHGDDIFVHYSSITTDRRFKTLRTGQVVEFELNDGPKGLHAQDVLPFDEYEDLEEEGVEGQEGNTFSPPRRDGYDHGSAGFEEPSRDGQEQHYGSAPSMPSGRPLL